VAGKLLARQRTSASTAGRVCIRPDGQGATLMNERWLQHLTALPGVRALWRRFPVGSVE